MLNSILQPFHPLGLLSRLFHCFILFVGNSSIVVIYSSVGQALFKFAELLGKRKIPYATVFGNHDDEGSLSRDALMSLTESLPYSLSEAGPTAIDGVGNYIVEVLAPGNSHHSALTLYMLDSHSYSPDERHFPGYDWIKPSQIDWFHQTAQGLKKAHREYTHLHMDLSFIHIPLPEYRKTNTFRVGSWKEAPTAPGFNSGFRDALVQEGVLLVSCGQYVELFPFPIRDQKFYQDS